MSAVFSFCLFLVTLLLPSCKWRTAPASSEVKIVSGEAAVPRAYPFMASVFQEKGMATICGGALIAPDVVVTAAHCFAKDWFPARNYKIRLGKTQMAMYEEGEELHEIRKILMHPDFGKPYPLSHDIALVYLKQKSRFPPIALAQEESWPSPGSMLTVIGWGRIHEMLGQKQSQLREVDLPLVDNQTCSQAIGLPLLPHQLCAGYMDHVTEKGSCKGDSGGPLFVKGDRPLLVGLVSGGVGCARIDSPAFYTRIASFRQWIELAQ